ncbi:uncharacterized protein EV422DRAFT_580969 [Fimicolochytrium jonesii]|uniref:uncharacterized protein n=1 Tax=Fimicolochytrium jonesii TaxID=1396493 RepID=UPI0022FED3B5|nr:uncharacterized protein EV422DRAFT_580969 [Fimicolochytrium jonesii]KAI8817216.1 hypothetical protein EV422DRAFT_580969 [Fimicolochytrium jonesii]
MGFPKKTLVSHLTKLGGNQAYLESLKVPELESLLAEKLSELPIEGDVPSTSPQKQKETISADMKAMLAVMKSGQEAMQSGHAATLDLLKATLHQMRSDQHAFAELARNVRYLSPTVSTIQDDIVNIKSELKLVKDDHEQEKLKITSELQSVKYESGLEKLKITSELQSVKDEIGLERLKITAHDDRLATLEKDSGDHTASLKRMHAEITTYDDRLLTLERDNSRGDVVINGQKRKRISHLENMVGTAVAQGMQELQSHSIALYENRATVEQIAGQIAEARLFMQEMDSRHYYLLIPAQAAGVLMHKNFLIECVKNRNLTFVLHREKTVQVDGLLFRVLALHGDQANVNAVAAELQGKLDRDIPGHRQVIRAGTEAHFQATIPL